MSHHWRRCAQAASLCSVGREGESLPAALRPRSGLEALHWVLTLPAAPRHTVSGSGSTCYGGCFAPSHGGIDSEARRSLGPRACQRASADLSGTLHYAPTRWVFAAGCHGWLICAHCVSYRGGMWGIFETSLKRAIWNTLRQLPCLHTNSLHGLLLPRMHHKSLWCVKGLALGVQSGCS